MPKVTRKESEIRELLQALTAGEVFPVSFPFSMNNPLSLSAQAAYGSFIADQGYAIVGVSMSAATSAVTIPVVGVLLLTKSSQHVHYPADGLQRGVDIARMVFRLENSKTIDLGGAAPGPTGLERHSVLLKKGEIIYAHAHNASTDGVSTGEITAYLLPVGDQ